ncbi:MAG: beta-(1-3)-glucosyl transferase, partial [Rhodospirillales bacterium]|nr:beta-(1-3)-glucosyl transferase [Rhodospirillales bacterium]
MKQTNNFIIPILIALLTVAAWALFNRPADEPPWPNRLQGFSFAPMRAQNDPALKNYPTVEEIDADLALLEGTVHAVRTYAVEDTLAAIPRLAAARDLNVTLGAWIGADLDANALELERLGELLSKGYRNLVRVMVGNE